MENPLPNDSLASISPPVGGCLRSLRRDWQKEECIKLYCQWLSSTIHLKTKISQSSPDSLRIQGPSKGLALASCIQSFLSKNAIERVENVRSLGFYNRLFLVPKAQDLPISRKVQNGVHQGLSDCRGMGVIYRPVRCLPSCPHPHSLKEVPTVNPRFSSVPVHLPPFRHSHGSTNFYNDCKKVKLMALTRGVRLYQCLHDWLIRAPCQEEAQVNTQIVVDLTKSLGWIIDQEKSELKPTQVFSFVGYGYHLDSALVKPTQERWLKLQDLILRLKSKSVFDVANWGANIYKGSGQTGKKGYA